MATEFHDAKKAAELLKADPTIRILDVRRPDEYAESHIKDAVLVDFTAPGFKDEAAKLDQDSSWLVLCRSGGRSVAALGVLQELGFQKLHHLDGGMLAWEEAGLPTER